MKPNGFVNPPGFPCTPAASGLNPKIVWNWDIEHADRKREAKADAAFHSQHPFQVDRKLLKDVVRERLDTEVGRIVFLSSGESRRWSHSLI
jgi:hypothetical protein